MAKHAKPTFFNKKIFLIILLFILALILLLIFKNKIINLFYKSTTVATTTNENVIISSNTESTDASAKKTKKTVIGANYLEILSFNLNYSLNNSEVSSSIKNNSSETHNNLNLLITFLDKNNNIITTLNCPIKSIEPNETKHTYGIVDLDLSNYAHYEISLLEE